MSCDLFDVNSALYLLEESFFEIEGGVCLKIPSTSSFYIFYVEHTFKNDLETISEYRHGDTLVEVELYDTFLYPSFAHCIIDSSVEGLPNFGNGTKGEIKDSRDRCPWLLLLFDPGALV